MWLILASASPRKPYVPIDVRSSNAFSLDVVNRSHKIGRSSFYVAVSTHQNCEGRTNIDAVTII